MVFPFISQPSRQLPDNRQAVNYLLIRILRRKTRQSDSFLRNSCFYWKSACMCIFYSYLPLQTNIISIRPSFFLQLCHLLALIIYTFAVATPNSTTMTIKPMLRKILTKVIKLFCLFIMTAITNVCYFEIGHDKGWPRADIMYSHYHKTVAGIIAHIPSPANTIVNGFDYISDKMRLITQRQEYRKPEKEEPTKIFQWKDEDYPKLLLHLQMEGQQQR